MSFFDKFMRSIGFIKDDDSVDAKKNTPSKTTQQPSLPNEFNFAPKDNIAFFSPTTQDEVKNIAALIKNGGSAKINLSFFEGASLFRAVDFLEGVCFVLDISPIFEGKCVTLKQ